MVPSSPNMTPHLPPNLIAHKIHPNLAASQTSVSSSGHREQIGIAIEDGNHPHLRPSYLICHPRSLPFQPLRPHLILSTFLPLPLPRLYPLLLWSRPLREHPSPPPWLRQVLNYSTRDCALYLSPRGFLSLLTYPSKPRAFAREGAQPTFPVWRVRSEVQQGNKSHKRALQG